MCDAVTNAGVKKPVGRRLQMWNGRGNTLRNSDDSIWAGVRLNAYSCAYVAAYSRADARRVIAEYLGRDIGDAEIRDYWHPCWGNDMRDVVPERGLWLDVGKGPVRVV